MSENIPLDRRCVLLREVSHDFLSNPRRNEREANNERIEIMTQPLCTVCGEPMPEGEDMFMYHGYSGPCPKPPLPKEKPVALTHEDVELIGSALEMYGENRDCEKQTDDIFNRLKQITSEKP